jgi:hypothetical protein
MFVQLCFHIPFVRTLSAVLALAGMVSCATVKETASAVFASNAQATGLVGGRVLQGQVSFTRARSGWVHLQSVDAPSLACFGALDLTATSSGVATLSCSDGQSAAIPFQVLSPLRGAGRSQPGEAAYGLTYGLPADSAAAHLGVPVERLAPTP